MSGFIKVVGKRFQQLQTITTPMPLSKVKVTVHMGTCGITAGAREVMTTLLNEKAKTDRNDIAIESAGCIGKCTEEPNITVEMNGQETVIYRKVTAAKAAQIFTDHLIGGKPVEDYVLPDNT